MTKKKETALAPSKQEDPQALIQMAIEKNVPVETMEKVVALVERMKAQKAKEAFNQSMADFQADCPPIVKTKEVKTKDGRLAYKYAPIESIVAQVKGLLQQYGFSYSTNMELLKDGVKVSVKVTHIEGHSEVSEMTVPLGTKTQIMSDTQVVAAAQTFAKRYAFCNAFGILTGDEDTDAAPAGVIHTRGATFNVRSMGSKLPATPLPVVEMDEDGEQYRESLKARIREGMRKQGFTGTKTGEFKKAVEDLTGIPFEVEHYQDIAMALEELNDPVAQKNNGEEENETSRD